MDYVIGIDCGSTKTKATAYGLTGNIISSCKTIAANFSSRGKEALNIVSEVIEKCQESISGKCKLIVIGASGMRGSGLSAFSEKSLSEKYETTVIAVDDGVLALKATLGSQNGMIVIAGTGSIVYCQKNNKVKSLGGWGHLLGERGCGYSVVISAIKSMVDRFDASGMTSQLDRVLLDSLSLPSPLVVPSFLYKATKAEVAALATVIEDAADKGCEEAVDIQKREGEALAEMVVSLAKSFDIKDYSLSTVGSFINNCKYARDSFFDCLKEYGMNVSLIESCREPERAVLAYYKEIEND